MVFTISITITLGELIQLGLLIVAVISLIYTIHRDRKDKNRKGKK